MASIFKTASGRLPDNRQAKGINAMPAIVVPAAVKVEGSAINGHPIYIDQLDKIKNHCRYLVAGGYIKNEVKDDVTTTVQQLDDAYKELEKNYGSVDIMENPPYHDNEFPEYLVCVNHLDVPDGCWWYEYNDCLSHPPLVRDALISGLYLLWKMGFQKATETEDWDMFEDIDGYGERFEYNDGDEGDKERYETYKKDVKFYKKDPIRLKWHSKAFHYHASRNTPLGDWLRCCWHYRKFNWYNFDGVHLVENSDEIPVMMRDCHRIIYVWDDMLCRTMYESIDMTWQNAGSVGMADYRVITTEGVIWEEKMPDKAQREKLSRDFTKLWTFDVEELKYIQLYRSTGLDPSKREPLPLPTIIPNEYDYRKRSVRTKAASNNLRKPNPQRVRGAGKAKRARTTRSQSAAIA